MNIKQTKKKKKKQHVKLPKHMYYDKTFVLISSTTASSS